MSSPRMLVQLSEAELEELLARAVARGIELERAKSAPQHLTAKEAAAALRCSDRKLRRLIATGQLPVAKLDDGGSSRVLVPREAIAAFLGNCTH